MDDIEWLIDRGDSDTLVLRWRGSDGSLVDFTGWTPQLFDVAPELEGAIDLSWYDASSGAVRIVVDSLPELPLRKSFPFRVRLLAPGGDRSRDRAFPRIRLVAQ